MNDAWTLTIDGSMYRELMSHLFPGDGDEHGAVIAAGITTTSRGTRLLARDLFAAMDWTGLTLFLAAAATGC
jgi:hypothetical protein